MMSRNTPGLIPEGGVIGKLPFDGQWLTEHSPTRRVPSHGTHLFATTYAFDFVAVDDDDRSYGAARERLDAVRAHAARTHDHDGRGPLTREPRGAPEGFEPRCSRFFVHAYIVAGRARRLLRCAATARRPARRGPSSCSAAAR